MGSTGDVYVKLYKVSKPSEILEEDRRALAVYSGGVPDAREYNQAHVTAWSYIKGTDLWLPEEALVGFGPWCDMPVPAGNTDNEAYSNLFVQYFTTSFIRVASKGRMKPLSTLSNFEKDSIPYFWSHLLTYIDRLVEPYVHPDAYRLQVQIGLMFSQYASDMGYRPSAVVGDEDELLGRIRRMLPEREFEDRARILDCSVNQVKRISLAGFACDPGRALWSRAKLDGML